MSMVSASGANIFPSTPCSVKSGTRMMAMMSTENATGRATSAGLGDDDLGAPAPVARRGEVAADVLDDHDRGVDDHADGEREPAQAHQVRGEARRAHDDEADRKVSGSETTTISAVRSSARKRNSTRMTKMPPSRSASATVSMHASMSEVRS